MQIEDKKMPAGLKTKQYKVNRRMSAAPIDESISLFQYKLENIEKRKRRILSAKQIRIRNFVRTAVTGAVILSVLYAGAFSIFGWVSKYLAFADAVSAAYGLTVLLFAAVINWGKMLTE